MVISPSIKRRRAAGSWAGPGGSPPVGIRGWKPELPGPRTVVKVVAGLESPPGGDKVTAAGARPRDHLPEDLRVRASSPRRASGQAQAWAGAVRAMVRYQ